MTVRDAARALLASQARDLHSIQETAKAMMKRVIARLEHYPEAKARLEAHLGDKNNEMRRLERVLENLDENPSGAKDKTMGFLGGSAGVLASRFDDDVLTSSMITYGLANYEIAAYETMIVLAEKADQPNAVPLLRQCLAEEQAMAKWLHEHLSPTLDTFLDLRSREGAAAAH